MISTYQYTLEMLQSLSNKNKKEVISYLHKIGALKDEIDVEALLQDVQVVLTKKKTRIQVKITGCQGLPLNPVK